MKMYTMNVLAYTLCVCCISWHFVISAPPMRATFGPCEGLDCLHGILMHGDEHQGESHSNEDIYNKLQSDDEHRGKMKGPDAQILPDTEQPIPPRIEPESKTEQSGPCEGMDCLHGVLMHADDEQGHQHEREHARMENSKQRHLPLANEADPAKAMHDSNDAHIHDDDNKPRDADKIAIAPNNADPEHAIHGGDSDEGTVEEHAGDEPVAGEEVAQVNKVETTDETTPDEKVVLATDDDLSLSDTHNTQEHGKPANTGILSNNADPEIVMHGNAHAHWVVKNEAKENAIKHDANKDVNPEAMLHGSDSSHVHSHHDTNNNKPKSASIPPGTVDPHALIHGDEYIGNVHAEDNDEYLRWKGADNSEDVEQQGYSVPDFSLGILNKLEEMKQKYLGALWASEDLLQENEDDVDNENSEDMRHELDILGNTAPLKTEH